jgi:hypothetical protein
MKSVSLFIWYHLNNNNNNNNSNNNSNNNNSNNNNNIISSHIYGKIIAEQTLELDEELCVCFIDCEKAFDRVN